MLDINVHVDGKAGEKLALPELVFGQEFNEPLIHQIVTAYLSGGRQGTKAQKTRAEVSGGGKKPWNQKGTGRARAGTTRGPLWRTGGVAFAAKPRDHDQKVNKKMYRLAMRSIFSELLRANRLHVVDAFHLEKPSTKALIGKIDTLFSGLEVKSALLIDSVDNIFKIDDATGHISFSPLTLSVRNISKVQLIAADWVDPVSLVRFDRVVLTKPALATIEELLS